MASKRKASAMAPADEEPVDPSDQLMFLALGGGNEVGRSCHILQYKGKTVMVSAIIPLFRCYANIFFLFSSTQVCIRDTMVLLRFLFMMIST